MGPQRLAAVLRRVAQRRPAAALGPARGLLAAGRLAEGAGELARLLQAEPADPPATLLGSAQALLARLGWTVRGSGARGAARLSVRRAGERRDLFALALARRGPQACGAAVSAAPVLRPCGRSRPLRPAERGGPQELAQALGLLCESLRGQDAPRGASPLAERHQGREGVDLLLRTTFACNQRCPFCFVALTGRHSDLAAIARELRALAVGPGRRAEVTLSGGEPTLDPRLPRLIALARRSGFSRVVLQTNAVLLARPGLLESLVRAGLSACMASFHAHRAELYDLCTGSRGQFPRAAAGLAELLRSRCGVTVNVVVNARNYRELPELVGFVAGLARALPRGRKPGVYFSMLNEAGHEKAPDWAVSLEDAGPYLRRAVARCEEEGLRVEPSGSESSFPACLLGGARRHAARREFPQDRVRYAEDFSGEAGAVGRAKRPACRRCPLDARCLGVPAQYARRYGLAGLEPLGVRHG